MFVDRQKKLYLTAEETVKFLAVNEWSPEDVRMDCVNGWKMGAVIVETVDEWTMEAVKLNSVTGWRTTDLKMRCRLMVAGLTMKPVNRWRMEDENLQGVNK